MARILQSLICARWVCNCVEIQEFSPRSNIKGALQPWPHRLDLFTFMYGCNKEIIKEPLGLTVKKDLKSAQNMYVTLDKLLNSLNCS